MNEDDIKKLTDDEVVKLLQSGIKLTEEELREERYARFRQF